MQQKHQQKSQQSSSSGGSLSLGSMPTPHQHLDKQAGKQRVGTSRPITPLGKLRVTPTVAKCTFSKKEKFQRVATVFSERSQSPGASLSASAGVKPDPHKSRPAPKPPSSGNMKPVLSFVSYHVLSNC